MGLGRLRLTVGRVGGTVRWHYLGGMVSRGALYGSFGRAVLYAGLLHEGGSLDACADLPLVVWAVANANGP